MTYFNTVKEQNAMLIKDYEERACKQERIVEALYVAYGSMSPSQVKCVYPSYNTPLTSIRRAITNLTTQGKLTKTERKTVGIYGRNECVWEIA